MLNIYAHPPFNSTAKLIAAVVPPVWWGKRRVWVWR